MIVARGMGLRVLMGTKFPLQDEKFSGCMLVMTTQRSELYQRGCVCVHAHAHTRALSQVRLCDSGLLSASLLCPWDSPGKNTGVGCHFLFQGILPTQESNSCLLNWQEDSLPLSHQGSPELYQTVLL